MKEIRIAHITVSLLLLLAISLSVCGCIAPSSQVLSDGVTPNTVTPSDDLSPGNAAMTDFAVRLLQGCNEDGKSTLVSPLSVLCALAMSVNGADDETRAEMERVLGMTADQLNQYVYTYQSALPQSESAKLSLANSIWSTDDKRFTVDRDFLQINADYYGADVFQVPFDTPTVERMNDWVNEHTDGMIPKIVDELPPETVMCLVNALAFDAEWTTPYSEYQVRAGTFTKQDGTVQDAELMHSEEWYYLEDEHTTGFIKQYRGRGYAFVALLPNEGVDLADYVASLDGASLRELLTHPISTTVYAAMPKFESTYDVELSGVLAEMGMPLAFEPADADFSRLGRYEGKNIYISSIVHKTVISVGEKGTKAGAVTMVVDSPDDAPMDPKHVTLDRPFLYMLIDCENSVPFFIGTVTELE